MFITLTLSTGNEKRFNIHDISSYVKYDYYRQMRGQRTDNNTSLYVTSGHKWTVVETPEEIDEILDSLGYRMAKKQQKLVETLEKIVETELEYN